MYLGFFAWYKGLALGGIAAVGQVQLLQPFLTIGFSALLLGEALDAVDVGRRGAGDRGDRARAASLIALRWLYCVVAA